MSRARRLLVVLLLNLGLITALVIVGLAAHSLAVLAAGSHRVDGLPVLIVSAVAAAVMLAGALILRGEPGEEDGGEDLNVTAVLLDTAADAAAAAGVAVSGAIIAGTGGWYWLDPAVALVITVIIGWQAQKLVRKIMAALR